MRSGNWQGKPCVHRDSVRHAFYVIPAIVRPVFNARPGSVHLTSFASLGFAHPTSSARPGSVHLTSNAFLGYAHPASSARPGSVHPAFFVTPAIVHLAFNACRSSATPATNASPDLASRYILKNTKPALLRAGFVLFMPFNS